MVHSPTQSGRTTDAKRTRARQARGRRPRRAGSAKPKPESGSAARAVGKLLRAARESQGLSQDQLSALTHGPAGPLSRTMISSIERGRNLPNLKALVVLTRALHMEPIEVLDCIEMSSATPVDCSGLSMEDLRKRAEQHFWSGEYRLALATYDAMLELLVLDPPEESRERRRRQARIEINRAVTLRRSGALSAARAAVERAIALARDVPGLLAEAYITLSSLLEQMGLTPVALDLARRAVVLSRDASLHVQSMAQLELGAVQFASGAYRDAYESFLQARDLIREARDPHHASGVEGNLGSCLQRLGKPKQAKARFLEAVELARKHALPASEALWLVALGRLAFEEQSLSEAEHRLAEALRIAKPLEHHLTVFRAEWLNHLIARARDPNATDRHRLAYLRRLYLKLQGHEGVAEIQEFRTDVLAVAKGERGAP